MSEDGVEAKFGGEGEIERHIEQSQSSFSPHVDELDSQFEHFGNVAFIEMSGIAARSRSPPQM